MAHIRILYSAKHDLPTIGHLFTRAENLSEKGKLKASMQTYQSMKTKKTETGNIKLGKKGRTFV